MKSLFFDSIPYDLKKDIIFLRSIVVIIRKDIIKLFKVK